MVLGVRFLMRLPMVCDMNRISAAATTSLTFRYLLAIVAIGMTCLASQFVIQSMLINAETQARMIDVAGRQRMLSQQIAKLTLRVSSNVDATLSPKLLDELSTSVRALRSVHHAIRFGDAASGVPRLESDEARARLDSIDAKLTTIVNAAEAICALAATNQLTTADAIRLADDVEEVEGDFLAGMDHVVALIADHSLQQINRLFWTERLITTSTLLLLLLEALFVFRPTVRHARDSIQGLRTALLQARSANENADLAIADRSTALSAAALDLKRISTEIDVLFNNDLQIDSQPHGERFNLLLTHVQSTLEKLTDLASLTDQNEVPLLVSRTSPRTLVKDAVTRFQRQIPADYHVNVTMDDRLPASLLVDEQVFRDSIIHLLQAVFDLAGHVSVHVGYDDREYRLNVRILGQGTGLAAAHETFLSTISPPIPRQLEFDSLDLLVAKRAVERLGGSIESSHDAKGLTIFLPLDETKQMNFFAASDQLQSA